MFCTLCTFCACVQKHVSNRGCWTISCNHKPTFLWVHARSPGCSAGGDGIMCGWLACRGAGDTRSTYSTHTTHTTHREHHFEQWERWERCYHSNKGSDAIIRTRGAMLSFVIDWLCVAQEHVDVVHQIQACSIHIVREQVLRSYWALLFHHIKLVVCADSPHQTGRVC